MIMLLVLLIGGAIGAGVGLLWGRGRLHPLQSEVVTLSTRLEAAQREIQQVAVQLKDAQTELQQEREQKLQLVARLSQEEATRRSESLAAAEKLREAKELREQLQQTFQALANEALASNNKTFLELAKERLQQIQETAKGDLEHRQKAIGELVQPLKQSLDKVEANIRALEQVRSAAYAGLKEQITGMLHSQSNLQRETANLVQALRAPQVRGQWGELQLERTVEVAGMIEYVDFVQQESLSTEDGRLRPDMLIRLPNGKQIVVDAKAPLDAYLRALGEEDPALKVEALRHHARQIRDHMRKLGAKEYWKQFSNTPEFVVLFIPGESFFSAALEQDPELITIGVSEKVILATPTTLIALLKTVAYGWRQEQIAEQAKQISDLGRELYERISVMHGHFGSLGTALKRGVDSYNKAMGSLESRVLVTARRFEAHGIRSDKKLDAPEMVEITPTVTEQE